MFIVWLSVYAITELTASTNYSKLLTLDNGLVKCPRAKLRNGCILFARLFSHMYLSIERLEMQHVFMREIEIKSEKRERER